MSCAAAVEGGFFPLDVKLGLGTEGYSPSIVAKIEFAGANAGSFPQASRMLGVLGEISVSAKHVQRLTERLGSERVAARDAEVDEFAAGRLKPSKKEPPAVVAIHIDAGKAQFREDDGAPGVRSPAWGDVKAGCFATYASKVHPCDPQPDPPATFLEPPAVARLVAELERVRGRPEHRSATPAGTPSIASPKTKQPQHAAERKERPSILVRTVVATLEGTERFGTMVAAEAQRRGFYLAARAAVVGDGGNWIGPLAREHFPGWHYVLDFLHLLVHLYAAASAAWIDDATRAWNLYERLLRAAWAGKPDRVIELLNKELSRMALARRRLVERKPLELTIDYVRDNSDRVRYDEYRRLGLPITSTLIESTIKQINQRVKGTEKFWTTPRLEAVLQSRAAHLSGDERAQQLFLPRKPGRAVGAGRLDRAA